jgi:hypothetical protein
LITICALMQLMAAVQASRGLLQDVALTGTRQQASAPGLPVP